MPPIDVSSDDSRSEDEIRAKKPTPRAGNTPRNVKPKPLAIDHLSDDDVEMIPATKSISVKQAVVPEPMDEDDDAEDESGDDNVDEYVVEKILDHHFDDEGICRFLVKWKGYEKKSDLTWEPTEHLENGANDILHEYFRKIGGRPFQRGPKRVPRDSISKTPQSSGKGKGRKGDSASGTPTTIEIRETRTDGWRPPVGTWEDDIQAIDTVEQDQAGLFVYVHWNNGRKSRHPIDKIYERCPQKMLQFYEQHLQFREGGATTNGNED